MRSNDDAWCKLLSWDRAKQLRALRLACCIAGHEMLAWTHDTLGIAGQYILAHAEAGQRCWLVWTGRGWRRI